MKINYSNQGGGFLYQQFFAGKSARYGPFIPILLSEVIDQLDNLLLQVSLNCNL